MCRHCCLPRVPDMQRITVTLMARTRGNWSIPTGLKWLHCLVQQNPSDSSGIERSSCGIISELYCTYRKVNLDMWWSAVAFTVFVIQWINTKNRNEAFSHFALQCDPTVVNSTCGCGHLIFIFKCLLSSFHWPINLTLWVCEDMFFGPFFNWKIDYFDLCTSAHIFMYLCVAWCYLCFPFICSIHKQLSVTRHAPSMFTCSYNL